jgi:hypothetical protein
MLRKFKSGRAARRRPANQPPYRSLSEGPSPEERLARLLTQVEERGIKPLTEEDFERFMAEPSAWPDARIDDFLAWRRQTRQEAR